MADGSKRQTVASNRQWQVADGGPQTADSRQRTADSGRQPVDSRRRTAEDGWRTVDSRRQMAEGRRQMAMEAPAMAGGCGRWVGVAMAGGGGQMALEGAASGTARDGYLCVC